MEAALSAALSSTGSSLHAMEGQLLCSPKMAASGSPSAAASSASGSPASDAGAAPGPRLMVRPDGTTCSLFEFAQLLRVPTQEPLPAPSLSGASSGSDGKSKAAVLSPPDTLPPSTPGWLSLLPPGVTADGGAGTGKGDEAAAAASASDSGGGVDSKLSVKAGFAAPEGLAVGALRFDCGYLLDAARSWKIRMLHPSLRDAGPEGASSGAGAAGPFERMPDGLVVPGSPVGKMPSRGVGPSGGLRAGPESFVAAGAGSAAPTAAIAGLLSDEAKPGDYDERGDREPMLGPLLASGALSPRQVWWYAQQLRRQAARKIAGSLAAGADPVGSKGVVATQHLLDEVLGKGVTGGSTATSGGIRGSSSVGDLAALTGQATAGGHGKEGMTASEAVARKAGGSSADEGRSDEGDEEGGPVDLEKMRSQVQWCDRLLKLVLEREHAYHLAYAAGDAMYLQPLRRDGARQLPWAADAADVLGRVRTCVPPAGHPLAQEFSSAAAAPASAKGGGSVAGMDALKGALASKGPGTSVVLPLHECLKHPLVRCIDSGHTGHALVDAAARTLRITGSVPIRLLDILIAQACKYMCIPWRVALGWLAGRCVGPSLPQMALRVQEKCGFVPDWVTPAPHPMQLGDPCGVAAARHPDPYGDFVARLVPRVARIDGPYRCSMHPDVPTGVLRKAGVSKVAHPAAMLVPAMSGMPACVAGSEALSRQRSSTASRASPAPALGKPPAALAKAPETAAQMQRDWWPTAAAVACAGGEFGGACAWCPVDGAAAAADTVAEIQGSGGSAGAAFGEGTLAKGAQLLLPCSSRIAVRNWTIALGSKLYAAASEASAFAKRSAMAAGGSSGGGVRPAEDLDSVY